MKTTLRFFLCKVAILAILAAGIFIATPSAAPTVTPPDAPATHAAHVASGGPGPTKAKATIQTRSQQPGGIRDVVNNTYAHETGNGRAY